MKEADDFLAECKDLEKLIEPINDHEYLTKTQFNDWSIEDVIGHLHVWNHAALLTLKDRDSFQEFLKFALSHFGEDGSSLPFQYAWLDQNENEIRGRKLFNAWKDLYPKVAANYAEVAPSQRVAWAGPDMTVRSKIIARQMETWAHGQELFDTLGVIRENSDRIKNIAHLGVTTYGWAFRNRGLEPPLPKPYVVLTAPSGAKWEWNEVQKDNAVLGRAIEFCQVVTQTRNVDDTDLETKGETARRWLEIAQCFAGPPAPPPLKGTRFTQN